MASNWRQTFEELKKKKEAIDKATSKKEINNINYKYNSTTNNKTMLDGYVQNNSLRTPNYVNTTPVPTTKKKEEKKWYQQIFDKGSFDDGYDFGDITKSILGTTADIGVGLAKGVSDIGQAGAKLVAGGVAQVSDWVGKDEYADKVRKRIAGKDEKTNKKLENYTPSGLLGKADEKLDGTSLIGETGDEITQGVGYYGGMLALQSVGVPWQVTAGVTSAGNELSNAYSNDAKDWEAWLSAGISAGVEIGSEYLFSGVKLAGTGKTTDKILGKVTDKISKKGPKYLAQLGIQIGGEGLEEVISGFGSAIGQKLTYMDESELNELYSSEDALKDFVIGAAVSGITQGASPSTYQNIKDGRSLITGRTSEQAKAIELETQNRIKQAEAEGITLTTKEKNAIEEQVENEVMSVQTEQNISTQQETNDPVAPVQEQVSVEQIDNQIAILEEQLMATEDEAEYQKLSAQIKALEQRAEQLEQQNIAPIQEEATDNIVPTTKEVIPPTVEQELTNITNQIDELETMLDTNLNATQQQEVLTQIKTLEQTYNEILQQQGQIQEQTAFKTASQQNVQTEEIAPIQKANVEQINKPTTQETNSNSIVDVESNTQNKGKDHKTKQLNIILKENPMTDDYHTGIRSKEDIKTFDEVIDDDESFVWGDFSQEDAKKALEKGKITVYSSYPIEQGVFVSTSKNQAQDYAGGGKVYSKTVPLNEVAWINGDEGQYAKVEETEKIAPIQEKKAPKTTENEQKTDRKTPTQEELDNLEYTRKNKSGSEYASAFYDLEKKYGSANLYKGLNNYKSTGKALEQEIAPVEKEIKTLTKEVKELTRELKEVKKMAQEGKPLTKEDLEDFYKQTDEGFKAITEADRPIFQEDTTPEYQYENDNEGRVSVVESPLVAEGRDMGNVGSRKVKAYQYEHPEVRPFFQEAAQGMMYDLDNSTKGQRIIVGDISQMGGGDYEYLGVKRNTTPDIAELLDTYNYTYNEIRDGLEAIIKDHGAENIAIAKRIEFALDYRLRNGYTAVDGFKMPANQEYIDLLKEKEWVDYYNSIPNNDIAPIENELDLQIDNALSNKNSKSKKYLGKVSDYVANKIKSVLGVNVKNRNHILTDNDIRHMIREHGNQKTESEKGQIAITKEDIKNIPDIIENPNDIIKGNDNKLGPTIRYIKRYNANTTYVVEVVPDNSNALIIKTMWKKPSTLTNSIAPSSTSETQGSDISSTFADNIAQNGRKVNDIGPVQSLAIEQAPTDAFDDGGPMIRVSPEMQKRTLNKPTETKNVNWEALEDTSKGEQQHLKVKKLGETLTPNNTDWDSLEDTSNAKQKQYNTETGQIEDAIEKKTKKEIKEKLLKETGILNANLDEANKIPKLLMENTDPIRLQEMIFGRGLGTQINNMFFQKVKDNTSKKIRFQNKERAEIKNLGIKARSKESAAVQKYGEKQWVNDKGEVLYYGDKELAIDFPDVETQNKIKKASQIIRQKYDSYLDTTNKVLTELGYNPIPKRNDYMRHFQELNDIFSRVGIPYNYNEMTANDLPTDINGLTHDFSPSKNFFANALERKGVRTTYDAITGIDGYLEGIGNLIYHTEDIQRLRAYEQYIRDTYGENHGFDNIENLTDEQKAERIEKIQDHHLSNYASWLHEYTNTLAGKKSLVDRGVEHILGRRIYSFLNTAKTQVGRNMIGFNLSSAMTNAIAGVQTLAKTNKLAAVKGLTDSVKNIFVNDGFVEKNNFLTSRFGSDRLSKNLWQRMGDAGFVFMQGTDHFVSNFVVRSKYNELKSKGLSDEQAHIEAGKYASRLMSDRSQGAMPNIYNSQMLGLVTQFQNEVNNQLYSMFYDTYHESRESAQGNALKTTAGMTFILGQMAVFTHLFGKGFEALTGYNPTLDIIGILMKAFGFDDDEESEDTVGDNLEQAFKQLANGLPYINILTGGGRIPVTEALPLQELFTGKDEFGNDKSRLKTLSEALPYHVMPTGYSQIKKTVQGLGMYDEDLPIAGSYTDSGNLRFTADESTWGKVQAGLFGRWANDEAQAYVDSEFKTINKASIDELIDLDMISSEYRKLKAKINKAGKSNEDKVNYIATLDELNDSQKNILVNNILDRDYDVDVSNYEDYGSYDEFNFYYTNREKYDWLKSKGISYNEYSATDESKELYNYAYKYPETYELGKAITGDFAAYKEYADYIWDLKADKDENGDSISGTKKTKVISYVNDLDLSIPQKAMLIRKTYSSFDDYNNEIVEYVDGLDTDYDTKKMILEAIDMTLDEDGYVYWD